MEDRPSLSAALAAALLAIFPSLSSAQSLEALSAQAGLRAPAALADFPVPALPAGNVLVSPASARRTTRPPPQAPSSPVSAQGRVAPNWQQTPGKLCTVNDPNFKEYRYAEQIPYCQRNVTYQMKQQIAQAYGVPESDWPSYEFDHLIPLAIGGNSSIDNVWPQPRGQDGSNGKDALEDQLYHEMANGAISQADAVKEIYAWFDGSAFAAAALKDQAAPAATSAAAK